MQFRKLAALAGSAIMTVAGATMPALAASVSQVNKISDLVSVTDSTTSFPLFVVGANAKTEDVAGAINVAVYFAGKSTVEKTVTTTGTSAISGVERQIEFGSSIYGQFGDVSYISVPALKQQDINYYGNKTTLNEKLKVGSGSKLDNDRGAVSGQSNGTVVATGLGGLEYRLTTQQPVEFATLSKTKPLPIKFLGKNLLITNIAAPNSISILQGTSATIDQTRDLTIGDYTIKFIMGNGYQAELSILKGGTEIGHKVIDEGSWDEFDNGNLKIFVSNAYEFAVYGLAKAEIIAAVGTDVEKTINHDSEYKTGDQSWRWQISFTASNKWGTSDYIGLKFSGTKAGGETFFLQPGESLSTPEDYVSLIYSGFTVDKYATITVEPVNGVAIYNSTASTGTIIIPSDTISGIKISSDQPVLSYEGIEGATDQKELWIFVNKTQPQNGIVAYYDAKTSKYVNATDYTTTNETVLSIKIEYDQTKDYIYYNSSRGLYSNITTGSAGEWEAPFKYNSTDGQFVLGTKGTAEAGDLQFNNTGSLADVGTWEHNVVDKYGVTAVSVKSNTQSDKIVIKYPAGQVKGKFGIGKATGTATAGGEIKYKEAIPIKTNVVKLDSEVGSADKTGSDMVLLGGPCVNSLVADLATAGKFDYSCSNWPAQNIGIIKVVQDAFASGKSVLIIAGTRAADTSLAALVVQNEEKLASITADKATVTGTSLSDVVVS